VAFLEDVVKAIEGTFLMLQPECANISMSLGRNTFQMPSGEWNPTKRNPRYTHPWR